MKEDYINRLIETIDRASAMSAELTRTCKLNMDVYDKHLVSLEESRDRAEKEAAESIATIKELTSLMTTMRNDYKEQVASLRSELHLLRDEYKSQLAEAMEGYRKLTESYTRLAEEQRGSRSEVNINH